MVTTEERVSRLEGAYEQVDQRLGGIEDRLIEMNSRINTLITVVIGAAVTLAVGMTAGFIALFIALR